MAGLTPEEAELLQAQAAASAEWYRINVTEKKAAGTYYTPGSLPQTSAEIQAAAVDAYNEQIKHNAAFHPETINYAQFANMPLSQIAARYGIATADRVQEYYRAHPSARYQEIVNQYDEQRGGSSENPYDADSAAGIAWINERQGGTVSQSLMEKAYEQGYQGDLKYTEGRETVPIRDLSSNFLDAYSNDGYRPGVDVYMPFGGYQSIRVRDAKMVIAETGEFGVYQPTFDPYTGEMRRRLNLVGGGGRAALQSGMFSYGEPLTPRTMTYEQWQSGNLKPVTSSYSSGVSRMGAEAYGGYAGIPLDSRKLTPDAKFSTYQNQYNLARLVSPGAANLGKSELPGANIPWSIGAGSPQVQYANERGLTGRGFDLSSSEWVVGGKTGIISTTAPGKQRTFIDEIGLWYVGAERTTSGIFGLNKLPAASTDQIKATAPYLAIFGQAPVAMALMTPGLSDYVGSYLKGELAGVRERPLAAFGSFGLGLGLGAGFRTMEAGVAAGRAAAAEKIISSGGMWRAADIVSSGAMKYAPKILGGLYAADVGIRSTAMGSEFSPKAAERLGGIVGTEARPMAFGAMFGYGAANRLFRVESPAPINGKHIGQIPKDTLGIITPKGEVTVPGGIADIGVQTSKGYHLQFRDMIAYDVKTGDMILPAPDRVRLETGGKMIERFGSAVSTDIRAPIGGEKPDIKILDLRENLKIIDVIDGGVKGIAGQPSDVRAITTTSGPTFGAKEQIRYSIDYLKVSAEMAFPRSAFFTDYAMSRTIPGGIRTMAGLPPVDIYSPKPAKPIGFEFFKHPLKFGKYGISGRGGKTGQVLAESEVMIPTGESARYSNAMFTVMRKYPLMSLSTIQKGISDNMGVLNSVSFAHMPMIKATQQERRDRYAPLISLPRTTAGSISKQNLRQEFISIRMPSLADISMPARAETADYRRERISIPDTFREVTPSRQTVIMPGVTTIPKITTAPYQDTAQVTRPRTTTIMEPELPRPLPAGFGLPMSGGGSRQYGGFGVSRWKRDNPVADIPYLSRGLSAPFSGKGKKKRRKDPFAGGPW